MKKLADVAFDPAKGAQELREFADLLASRAELAERADIQQFFRERRHLCALVGSCGPHGSVADCLAFEFPIVGDFSADLVAGNREPRAFLFVELEDAKQNSVFTRAGERAARDWSPRFNHGFSQLVDWFCSLDDFKRTRRFSRDFGGGHVRFSGLLVIGRSANMDDDERQRLSWRADKVKVDSVHVGCMTYDDLYNALSFRMRVWGVATEAED
ncbi:MAG TPA: Shedu immune nuclease family protein [Pirellulales bacterium]|nr:Shedu immune nuclease family protein [Pirellulales bacterium]